MVNQDLIDEMVDAIRQEPQQTNNTHSAIVSHVDDEGIVWVNVAGSDRETPTASASAEVKPGDAVTVEWRNDRLYIAGNYSNPSAGVSRVAAVENEATRARVAADAAVESAQVANEAASAAQQSAADAETAAGNAQTSADNASEYAARALGNLSTVQSVTETLNWITSHGTMTKTDDYVPSADIEVVEGKKYYTRSGSGTAQDPYVYTLVSNPTGDPSASGYYEGALDLTHVYFVQDSNGDYTVGGVKYAIVPEPNVSDIGDYYVLSIDESLNNYVATHLAVTSEGLWIIPDAGGNKVLIATGQGQTYTEAGTYIIGKIDNNDVTLAKFLANTVQIGADNKGHTIISNDGLQIYSGYNGAEELANLGYGLGNAEQGTQRAPYFTFGTRRQNSAVGNYSIAEGYRTTASGPYSHAEGNQTIASGLHSHASGLGTTAAYSSQTAIGQFNSNQPGTLFEIGNGEMGMFGPVYSNAFTVDTDGNIETALSTTAAAGTTDGDLYAAITALGWESEVID